MTSPPPAPAEPLRIPHRRSRHRAAWVLGLSASAVVHLVLLVLYGGVSGPPGFSVSPGGEGASELQGLELLNLVAALEEELDRPEEPEEEPEPQAIPVEPRAVAPAREAEPGEGLGVPEAEVGPLGPTAADRLRVRVEADPRLFAPLASEDFGAVSMQRFLESDLAWRLGLWADSAAMEAARQRRSLDWTWADDSGGRWGVSPEGIHLGSITLPLPSFAPAYGAARERAYIDEEVARGTSQILIWETLEERAEAIRRRRDAERAEERAEGRETRPTRVGPRRIRPDTTSVPRLR
ncbi:MAG: hypothetical protein JSU98_12635 [Gemmatimonadales bacterium]|nr:MAG: hypothetical protein JSU98_12635 [Gemmatimonadales bacterium]